MLWWGWRKKKKKEVQASMQHLLQAPVSMPLQHQQLQQFPRPHQWEARQQLRQQLPHQREAQASMQHLQAPVLISMPMQHQ